MKTLFILQAKHIQFVSGVGSFTYWFATYCWDLINFLVPAIGIIILFAAFQLDTYKGDDLGAFVVMLVRPYLHPKLLLLTPRSDTPRKREWA